MDISELTIGALILSPVPICQDYRKSGQCFRCGSHGHQVKNYIWLPESTSSGSGSGKRVTIAAVNDDSGSNSGEFGGGPTLDTAFNRVWRAGFAA
jgi:hypothetical protein